MSTSGSRVRRVDVVILTAITLEYQAALQVEAGAWEGSHWEKETGPNGLPVAFRTFHGKGDRRLRVAVAQAGDMGAVAATNALLPLVEAYRPRCVAMCGVCAGRPKKTNLGDVVAAERLFFHDTGKKLPDEVQQDLKTYNLRDDWKVALEHFDFAARFRDAAWWKQRPVPYEWQENWVLVKLNEGVANPSALPECNDFCPQWETVIESLWKSGHVQDGTLTLSDEGRKRIGPLLIKHRNRLPSISPSGALIPFEVHVAPMGSGSQVVEDEEVWSFVSEHMRKTLGLEMEAAALGALAHAQRERKLDALVMKGVMDFANHGRDDHFKEFAARASAECLLAFLREHLEVEVVPDVDDLLVSGAEQSLPENPPPSVLLNARYEVVPFHEQGRAEILAELDLWCDEGPQVAVRLLHAEGGVGKTRLAIEWVRRRRSMGWAAGFLPKDVPDNWFDRLWSLGQPVLVVLDYAESRADLREVLPRVLRYSQQTSGGELRYMRLLLLARNAGDWWLSLRQSDTGLGIWLDLTPPYELPPLALEQADREAVFHEAAEKFANMRGRVYTKHASVLLSEEHFERVLYLHMAALAFVESLSFEANTLMDVILDHEERFWVIRARQASTTLMLQQSLARQMVAAATLRGGLADFATTAKVAGRILGRALSPEDHALLRLLQMIYQCTGEHSAVFLPALEPDLLGEGMVLRVASPKLDGDRPPIDWIERVFPPNEEPYVAGMGLEVLGRASASRPAVVRPWLERLLACSFQSRAVLALKAAQTIGLRTAFSVLGDVLADQLEAVGDLALARELDAVGIPYPTVSLNRVAEWTDRMLLQGLPMLDEPRVIDERARILNNLSTRLSGLGRFEDALKVGLKATEFYRLLARDNPDEFQDRLAASLSNLGTRLSALGRHEEALTVTYEAVALYRILVQRDSEAFKTNLASGLNNLGNILSWLGRHEEALAATREAAELYRFLAQRSLKGGADLAMSLNNQGSMLSGLGRYEEALVATYEAVELYRSLAHRNPDAFMPDLAMSLSNLGSRFWGLGRHEHSLQVAYEAVELYRSLAQRNPGTFKSYLAGSLSNMSVILRGLGLYEDALEVAREAVELYRPMSEFSPDAFLPHLASSLNNMGSSLSVLGRHEDALGIFREVVEIRRLLAQRNPDAFLTNLAGGLNNLGNTLSALDRREEAMSVMREAVELYRSLVQRNPGAFKRDLAASLSNLGTMLSRFGRNEAALEAMREAIVLYRLLAQENSDAFRSSLASSLNNMGAMLSELGRREDALSVVGEAVDNIWPLFERLPFAFAQNTSIILRHLRGLHESLQRPLSPVLQERIATFERLTQS